jgi:hypothetical protein
MDVGGGADVITGVVVGVGAGARVRAGIDVGAGVCARWFVEGEMFKLGSAT